MEDENATVQSIGGGGLGRASTWIVEEQQSQVILEEVRGVLLG